MSVVTFVGQAAVSNAAPELKPVADQTINAGQTLVITNTTLMPLAPSQTLTFSLMSGPPNSTVGAASGVFSWRPSVNQAGTTNVITVKAANNSTPSQGATNSFVVFVNPLSKPVLSSLLVQPGQVRLLIAGPSGPDYTLATSTNLMDWQVLIITNSPALPMTLEDTNVGRTTSFYRIQIGP
jgi:hypothetical protein